MLLRPVWLFVTEQSKILCLLCLLYFMILSVLWFVNCFQFLTCKNQAPDQLLDWQVFRNHVLYLQIW